MKVIEITIIYEKEAKLKNKRKLKQIFIKRKVVQCSIRTMSNK